VGETETHAKTLFKTVTARESYNQDEKPYSKHPLCACCRTNLKVEAAGEFRGHKLVSQGKILFPCQCKDSEKCSKCAKCADHHKCDQFWVDL
jgi:hypothetical protein